MSKKIKVGEAASDLRGSESAPDETLTAASTHEQIAQLAYERWQQGGFQPGTAELDWAYAEAALLGKEADA